MAPAVDCQLAEILAAMGVVDRKSRKLIQPQTGVCWHERRMSITWRLNHPMPAELFEEMKVVAKQMSALRGWGWHAVKKDLAAVTIVQW